MPVVFDNVETPGQQYDDLARVDVYLVASADDSTIPGVIAGSDISILDKITGYTNGAGYVAFTLRANPLITPANSYYIWETHLSDGRVNRRAISVPNGAGPYHVADIEVSPAPSQSPFFTAPTATGAQADRPTAVAMAGKGRDGWTYFASDLGILWRWFEGLNDWALMTTYVGLYAQVERTATFGAAQSIPNNTWTAIDGFDSEIIDPWGFHAANAANLTPPTGFGRGYALVAAASFASNATGARGVRIKVNGNIKNEVVVPPINGRITSVSCPVAVNVVAGQAVTVEVLQTSGGALALATDGNSAYARLALSGS